MGSFFSIVVATSVVASAAASGPILFMEKWLSEKVVARPTAKGMLGLSLKHFNDFRRESDDTALPDSGDYCFLEAMRKDALVSPDRETQESIDFMFGHVPDAGFDLVAKNGVQLTVGIYQRCQPSEPSGNKAGSLLVASKDGKLLWMAEYEALPIYLVPSRGKELAAFGSCLACGDVTELYYDPANQQFYTKFVGD